MHKLTEVIDDIPKEEEKEKEVIIVVEDEQDTKTELPKDDDVVLARGRQR